MLCQCAASQDIARGGILGTVHWACFQRFIGTRYRCISTFSLRDVEYPCILPLVKFMVIIHKCQCVPIELQKLCQCMYRGTKEYQVRGCREASPAQAFRPGYEPEANSGRRGPTLHNNQFSHDASTCACPAGKASAQCQLLHMVTHRWSCLSR